MPISPEKQKRYPGGSTRSQIWQDIRAWVRRRSGDRCEGSPAYPDCNAQNGRAHPVTGSIVVLTVAHLKHDPGKNGPDDVMHWCQRCHLTYDAPEKARVRAEEKRLADVEHRRAVRRKALQLKGEMRP